MNHFPQDLISNTKLYDSHPCADMIQNALEQRTFSLFVFHDYNSLEEDEYSYEFDAVDVVHDAALDAQKTAMYHSLRAGMLEFDVPLIFHIVESIGVMPDSLNLILK